LLGNKKPIAGTQNMEISKLLSASQNTQQANSVSAEENSKSKAKSNSVAHTVLPEVDKYDSSLLDSIKSFVANAKQASRASYVASLKEVVEFGSYNPSTNSIVNAMFADGTIEALL